MKCPRNKFVNIDYTGDVEKQKQETCLGCNEYNGQPWGKHCSAKVTCIKCGADLPQDYFMKLPKENRSVVTHGICPECHKNLNKTMDNFRKTVDRRRPW